MGLLVRRYRQPAGDAQIRFQSVNRGPSYHHDYDAWVPHSGQHCRREPPAAPAAGVARKSYPHTRHSPRRCRLRRRKRRSRGNTQTAGRMPASKVGSQYGNATAQTW